MSKPLYLKYWLLQSLHHEHSNEQEGVGGEEVEECRSVRQGERCVITSFELHEV